MGEDERVGARTERIACDSRTLGIGRREAGKHRQADEAGRTHHVIAPVALAGPTLLISRIWGFPLNTSCLDLVICDMLAPLIPLIALDGFDFPAPVRSHRTRTPCPASVRAHR